LRGRVGFSPAGRIHSPRRYWPNAPPRESVASRQACARSRSAASWSATSMIMSSWPPT
jgi:hypothetical protein